MRALVLLTLVFMASPGVAEVYRWVDDNGVTHFSDRPVDGAETIALGKAQTFSTPRPQPPARRISQAATQPVAEQTAEPAQESPYKRFAIVKPEADEVFYNTGGSIRISMNAVPSVRRGHTLVIFLDNKKVREINDGKLDTELTEVYRGQHEVRAEIRDTSGNVLASTSPVKFMVQQTSIQNPNNPNVLPPPTAGAG